MKKCQGLNPAPSACSSCAVASAFLLFSVASAFRRKSVEVAELIVQPFTQRGIVDRIRLTITSGRPLRGFFAARPPERDDRDERRSGGAREVWKEPSQAVESLVDRRRERFLAAVLRDVVRVDLVARFACGDHLRDFLA